MAKTRVLVVEDTEIVQERYRLLFEEAHKNEFLWVLAPTGQKALLVLEKHLCPPIDVVVLDWNLPDMEGLAILKQIKSDPATRSIPVLMVTGHVLPQDAAAGLETGADDYLKKDFGNDEFIARLRNLLRRRQETIAKQGGYALDGLTMDVRARKVALNGRLLKLHVKEFELLQIFLERPNIVHSQGYLAEALSAPADATPPGVIRQRVYSLRNALGSWGERIEAHWGKGYSLNTKSPVSRG